MHRAQAPAAQLVAQLATPGDAQQPPATRAVQQGAARSSADDDAAGAQRQGDQQQQQAPARQQSQPDRSGGQSAGTGQGQTDAAMAPASPAAPPAGLLTVPRSPEGPAAAPLPPMASAASQVLRSPASPQQQRSLSAAGGGGSAERSAAETQAGGPEDASQHLLAERPEPSAADATPGQGAAVRPGLICVGCCWNSHRLGQGRPDQSWRAQGSQRVTAGCALTGGGGLALTPLRRSLACARSAPPPREWAAHSSAPGIHLQAAVTRTLCSQLLDGSSAGCWPAACSRRQSITPECGRPSRAPVSHAPAACRLCQRAAQRARCRACSGAVQGAGCPWPPAARTWCAPAAAPWHASAQACHACLLEPSQHLAGCQARPASQAASVWLCTCTTGPTGCGLQSSGGCNLLHALSGIHISGLDSENVHQA